MNRRNFLTALGVSIFVPKFGRFYRENNIYIPQAELSFVGYDGKIIKVMTPVSYDNGILKTIVPNIPINSLRLHIKFPYKITSTKHLALMQGDSLQIIYPKFG